MHIADIEREVAPAEVALEQWAAVIVVADGQGQGDGRRLHKGGDGREEALPLLLSGGEALGAVNVVAQTHHELGLLDRHGPGDAAGDAEARGIAGRLAVAEDAEGQPLSGRRQLWLLPVEGGRELIGLQRQRQEQDDQGNSDAAQPARVSRHSSASQRGVRGSG